MVDQSISNDVPGGDVSLNKYLHWDKYRFYLRKVYIRLCLHFSSARARFKLKRSKKRGLFIDCGSNVGQGFDLFRAFYTPQYFDFELFEPNPYCFEVLAKKTSTLINHNLKLHQKAVGTKSEKLKFFGLAEDEGGKYSQGGSTLKEHNTKRYNASEDKSIEVEAISFVSFLREKSKRYELIVIKMDIEGAEYPVIESMLKENVFDLIETLYVEFHSRYMTRDLETAYRMKEKRYLKEISKTGCATVLWI